MPLFLLLACAYEYDEASNLCGTIVRPIGSPPADDVIVWAGGCDTAASPDIAATSTPDGNHFQATLDPGTYAVEVFADNYRGCEVADVPDAATCAAEVTVTLRYHMTAKKPNLYLYPERPTDIAVRIPAWRTLTETDPPYPDGGWRVNARPDGLLATPIGPRDFLFYELRFDPARFQTDAGWCVPGALAQATIEDAMVDLGFLPNEIADFAEGWDGTFPDADVLTVYPQFDGLSALEIDPPPASLLRTWFYVAAGCSAPEAPELPSAKRRAYHAAEWGVAFAAELDGPG